MCCCVKKIAKLLLFVFNIGFFILGAVALAIGIWLVVDRDYLFEVIGKIPTGGTFSVDQVVNTVSFLESAAYMLIAVGGFIFIIGFCGLCGGIKESKPLLLAYAVLVFIILALEIAAGVLGYFYSSDVEMYLQNWITSVITSYYVGSTLGTDNLVELPTDSTGISSSIDLVQVQLSCCGTLNYTTYDSSTTWPGEYNYTDNLGSVSLVTAVVPISCCKVADTAMWPSDLPNLAFTDLNACITTASEASTNTLGCYTTVLNLLLTYSRVAIGIGLGVGLVEILGIMAASCLIHDLKQSQTKVAL